MGLLKTQQVPALQHDPLAENNKLQPADIPVHGWYRFVLSYPPHLVRLYLNRFGVARDDLVLDPFCGTGTTLVECKKLRVPSIGTESNPMAHFAAATKLAWGVSPADLESYASKVVRHAARSIDVDGVPAEGELARGDEVRVALRTLSEDAEKLILANSICPLPLHRTLRLLETIRAVDDGGLRDHALLALASSTVNHVSNLHFGPEVGVKGRKRDCPVLRPWEKSVGTMARDIGMVRDRKAVKADCHLTDSRELSVLEDESVSAVITSPPYPNEKDYTRTTRLESVLLGFMEDRTDLRTLKQGLLRSNTRNVYKGDEDDKLVADIPEIWELAEQIEARRVELGKTSGFEKNYHRVVTLYFGGMAKHLAELSQKLRPGARLAYVVGDQASFFRIKISTGTLLAKVAEDLGYKVESIDLFRTRFSTVTQEHLNEEVVVLRWG